MAHILIVDDSATAVVTLKACLVHAQHRLESKRTIEEAWQAMQHNPLLDLLILDLSLGEEDGYNLLNSIRNNLYFKNLPVLIYTVNANRDTVAKVLDCGIQNYLLKPAKPDQILYEAHKAESMAWRADFFAPFAKLQQQHGYDCEAYIVLLKKAKEQLLLCEQRIHASLAKGNMQACGGYLEAFKGNFENLGCPLLGNIVASLRLLVEQQNPVTFARHLYYLPLLAMALDEKMAFLSDEDQATQASFAANPKPTETLLLEKMEALEALPSFGNLVQSLKERTQSADFDIKRVAGIVKEDPGLTLQVMSMANAAHGDAQHELYDIEMAIQLLGMQKIQSIALSTHSACHRHDLFTAFDWPSFWVNQMGCALVCKKMIEELNAPSLPQVYLAGLLHGMGQMIMSNYYPDQYAKAVHYAKHYKIGLHEAELEFFGISHDSIGAKYAHKHNLPESINTAIRYQHQPAAAAHFQEVSAVLNVAIFLSTKYKIGNNGMPTVSPHQNTLNKLPAWKIIKDWAQPQTAVENFEAAMARHIRFIKAKVESDAERYAQNLPL